MLIIHKTHPEAYKFSIKIICLIAAVVFLYLNPALGKEQYDYINISDPFLREIPIAIPVFATVTSGEREKQISEKMSDLLSRTLAFTGYFKLFESGAIIRDPQKPDSGVSNINFKAWTGAGVELLITGRVLIKDNLVEIELRLFDTFKEQLLVGKRYKGWVNDYRRIIHRFCSEVIYNLFGDKGFFDTKIAFVSTGSGNKELWICNFDGYDPKQFTNTNQITLFPAWSFDANWIAYTSYKRGKPDLYIKHLTDKRGAVISLKGSNITPAWAPGKLELAASLSFSGDPDIYLLTKTGKIIKQVTIKWGIDLSPTWSPDGKKIAFVSSRSGSPQIYIKKLDSGRVERLTFYGQYNTQPDWSPKGDRIAYSAMQNGETNIFVIGIKAKKPIQLTYDAKDNEAPSWSPDGSHIVFSSTREGTSRIYIMTTNGTNQRRLLVLPGEQTNPKWSPRIIN